MVCFRLSKAIRVCTNRKKDLRHAEGIFLAVDDAVKLLDGIVGDVAQGAAEKGRNTGHRHRPVILQQFLQGL